MLTLCCDVRCRCRNNGRTSALNTSRRHELEPAPAHTHPLPFPSVAPITRTIDCYLRDVLGPPGARSDSPNSLQCKLLCARLPELYCRNWLLAGCPVKILTVSPVSHYSLLCDTCIPNASKQMALRVDIPSMSQPTRRKGSEVKAVVRMSEKDSEEEKKQRIICTSFVAYFDGYMYIVSGKGAAGLSFGEWNGMVVRACMQTEQQCGQRHWPGTGHGTLKNTEARADARGHAAHYKHWMGRRVEGSVSTRA